MFNEVCSIYSDALDNVGRYVDMETGECIQQMTIREFCLTDRWKPYVVDLRYLIEVFGSKAKKVTWKQVCDEGLAERYQMYYERMVDDIKSHRRREDTDADIEKRIEEGSIYDATKKSLPGATLSGLFATWNDECFRKDGSSFYADVSRRETHLWQYTGWLVIDIDAGDNQHLSNFENIRGVLCDRPEVAMLMHSCSGTGLFGLVRLDEVPPLPEGVEVWKHITDHHKARFKALREEYAALGVMLDKQCSNIGRVRFASWDEPSRIYINDRCTPYMGVAMEEMVLAPKAAVVNYSRPQTSQSQTNGYSRPDHWWEDRDYILRMTELLVSAMVSGRHSITTDYGDWVKVGWSLKHHPQGERLFHQLSSIDPNYKPGETAQKWHQLGGAKTVTHEYLFSQCRHALGDDEYKRIGREAWNSRF